MSFDPRLIAYWNLLYALLALTSIIVCYPYSIVVTLGVRLIPFESWKLDVIVEEWTSLFQEEVCDSNVMRGVGDSLSRKERVKPRRVRGMILASQSEAFKQENVLLVGSVMVEAHASRSVLGNSNLHVPLNEIKIDKTLRFVEEPVKIMDREIKSLKRSRIPLVKVRWNSKRGPEFTWEREDYMKSKYPHLFVDRAVEPTS
ncbi:hypothetical protein Tco_0846012 [Tanacetum coccineum]